MTADLSNQDDSARAAKRAPIERGSLVDEVARRIRAEILNGTLRPGQRIPVAELSRELAVSPIPIREAIRLLESESLVDSKPHQAPTVSDVGLEELSQIYNLRRLIECDTGRLGVERADLAAVEVVNAALHRLLASDPQDRNSDFWAAHRAFHMAVLQGGLDPWRQRILSLLWQSSERYQRLNTWVFGTTDGGVAAHTEIARAFTARDADRLETAIAYHLTHTEQTVIAGYQKSRSVEAEPKTATPIAGTRAATPEADS